MGKSAIAIKPSHKGLLHKDLGVPAGTPIPAKKLAQAKHSSDPAERKRATFAENARSWHHGSPGKVASIDAHPDGKHATVRITHGKRKKDPHSGALVGYHQPSSSVTVPTAHAKQYAVGQRVHAGLSPAQDDAEDAADRGADERAEGEAPPRRAAKGKAATKKSARTRKPRTAPAPASPIASAMAPSGY